MTNARSGGVVFQVMPGSAPLRGATGATGAAGATGPAGATGATGARGADGVGAPFYALFADPEELWIVNHNLGRPPVGATVATLGGVEITADVQNVTPNQTRVYFDVPTAGTFTCL